MKKRRVRLFVDGEVLIHPHFSGIGHYTADLLKAMDTLLYQPEYSHFSVEIGVPYMRKHLLSKYGFENFAVRGIPMPASLVDKLKYRKRLPPIDLLFGKMVYLFPNYSSWPTWRSPVVPIIYDLSFVYHADFVEPNNQRFLVDQVQLSVKRATKVVTISKNSQNEITEHYKYPVSDTSIVYPAVDMRKFYRRSQSEVNYVKAKYGVFGKYILFVGNIEPRKNLITLLQAYQKLPKDLQSEYSLLLIGAKGWLDNEIKDTIISMRMSGMKVLQPSDYVVDTDLPAIYSGASVFAYVSRYEGFGIPPIEAMACGVPAITSNNSSLPEAVGKAALLADALDINEIAKGLERLLKDKDEASRQVTAGYDQVMKFDWSESAKVLLKTVEEAAR